uniref:Uncharacterized protein n=1 Tax=Panagrolaimus sp. JU765 TaxID=591449 RepID=A0AC34R4I9_9BILA
MDVTTSTTLDNFKLNQPCSLALKFILQADYNNGTSFFLECQTADGLK